jgi:hypothetical protein
MWRSLGFLYVALFVPLGGAAYAQESALGALAGVDSVYILAEQTSALLVQAGINDTTLAESATKIMSRANIVLTDHDQWLGSRGGTYLYVRANAVADQEASTAAYMAVVELRQDVQLIRDNAIHALGATTWRSSVLGVVPVSRLADQVRESMPRLIREFLAAYEAANPGTSVR